MQIFTQWASDWHIREIAIISKDRIFIMRLRVLSVKETQISSLIELKLYSINSHVISAR